MKKSANIFLTMILAAATIACGSNETPDTDVTLRVFLPEVSPEGMSSKVEYLNPASGSFEFLARVGMDTLDDAFIRTESIRGVKIEVGETSMKVPAFATTIYIDGMVSDQPLQLKVPVTVDDVLRVRMQLVGTDEDRTYPEELTEIVAAQKMPVNEEPILPIRE
jgi:hypothetical protein